MKRIFYILLVCAFLCGCSATVTDLSHHKTYSTVATQYTGAPSPTPDIPINPYGPIDFGYEGDYMACFGGEYMLGIDVSHWQTDVDWQQVKEAGITFVMIRVGQRGSEQGTLSEDRLFRQHYEGAKAAGLQVGCYFFSQAITPEEAAEEARYVLDRIGDWELDMPVAYDWEFMNSENARTNGMEPRALTDCAIAFCEAVKEAGFRPMLYFNQEQARTSLYLEELTDYEFWLAMYSDDMTYNYQINMWQYTQAGTVPGISQDVDLNLYLLYN